jgi:hypothetical protein
MLKDADFGWSVVLKLLIVGSDAGTRGNSCCDSFFKSHVKQLSLHLHDQCSSSIDVQSAGKRPDKPAVSFLRFNRSMARHRLLRIRNVCGVCKINSAWNLVLEETVLL